MFQDFSAAQQGVLLCTVGVYIFLVMDFMCVTCFGGYVFIFITLGCEIYLLKNKWCGIKLERILTHKYVNKSLLQNSQTLTSSIKQIKVHGWLCFLKKISFDTYL